MLEIKRLSKRFQGSSGTVSTLSEINLKVHEGEFICLLGPSGCGKSTLLNIIAGLDSATEGQILLNGNEIRHAGPDRVVIFQEAALFPWLKVIDNVEYGMKINGVSQRERHEKALKYLKMVHLSRFANAYPHQLSGGMRQRVALARALTMDSPILLMDEPFSALDHQTTSILHSEIQEIWQLTGKTIIFVTHNVEEAVLLADRVIMLSTNPGTIKKEFKVQLARPRSLENRDLAYVVAQIIQELKEEVEKVAKEEFDSDWSLQKDSLLPGTDNYLGGGI